MERLTFDGGAALSPAISPDGNLIAYASDRDGSFSLYLRQFGARQSIRLTGPESKDWYPCFSPDGLKIVYRSEREGGGLYVRDALAGPGGAERKLVDGGEMPSVSPDGTTIAYLVSAAMTGSARLFVVSAGGGAPRPLQADLVADDPGGGRPPAPLWSPDGTGILFRGMRVGDPKTRGWWVAPVGGGEAAAIEGMPRRAAMARALCARLARRAPLLPGGGADQRLDPVPRAPGAAAVARDREHPRSSPRMPACP